MLSAQVIHIFTRGRKLDIVCMHLSLYGATISYRDGTPEHSVDAILSGCAKLKWSPMYKCI